MKIISDTKIDEFPSRHVSILEIVLSVMSITASIFFLYQLYVYLNVDGIHPVNVVFYHFGIAPIVGLNIPDFMQKSIFGLIPAALSISSAILLYFGLAGISARLAYKFISAYTL